MVVYIPLSKQGKKAGKYEAIVSDEDKDLAELRWQHKPASNKKGDYAWRYETLIDGKHLNIGLHQSVLERVLARKLQKGEYPDHINGNGLDNRRENLRLATHSQNQMNRKISKNNKLGHKGIYWVESRKKWRAYAYADNKKISVGYFKTLEEAQIARFKIVSELHGDFYRGE